MDQAIAMTIHPRVGGCNQSTSEAAAIRCKVNTMPHSIFKLSVQLDPEIADRCVWKNFVALCVGLLLPTLSCSACKLVAGNDQLVVTLKQKGGEK
jgi:hypothetical protein